MNRFPAAAGQFYPEDIRTLSEEIQKHVDEKAKKTGVIGVVTPHAGFVYSGDVAGAVYSRIEIPDTVILIGPNHTGQGEQVSVMTSGAWSMPFGDLNIDEALASAICENSRNIQSDFKAHRDEHSLETQLPFLQFFRKDFKIVPICLMRVSLEVCADISQAILTAVSSLKRVVLIVASSDMTHYESHANASRKDRQAIDRILERDPEGLYDTVMEKRITMCGLHPVTVMLMCANRMGAQHSELVKYMTSGEVSGDMDQVVGYAGMIVS